MTRLYTGKGDTGHTDLLGDRVGKSDPRIEALGELDEATSAIGLARSLIQLGELQDVLIQVQRDLYRIMADIAFTDDLRPEQFSFSPDGVDWLEQQIGLLEQRVELAPAFILPGETTAGGATDLARAVVRRAERRAVSLNQNGLLENANILRYLNRLSSLLFIVARAVETISGAEAPRAKN